MSETEGAGLRNKPSPEPSPEPSPNGERLQRFARRGAIAEDEAGRCETECETECGTACGTECGTEKHTQSRTQSERRTAATLREA